MHRMDWSAVVATDYSHSIRRRGYYPHSDHVNDCYCITERTAITLVKLVKRLVSGLVICYPRIILSTTSAIPKTGTATSRSTECVRVMTLIMIVVVLVFMLCHVPAKVVQIAGIFGTLKFSNFKSSRGHLQHRKKNRHMSETIWPIAMRFGAVAQVDRLNLGEC